MKKWITHKLMPLLMLLTLASVVDDYPEGDCLEGDCQNGYGRGVTDNGLIYNGSWLDGEPHGLGKVYNFTEGKSVLTYFEYGEVLGEETYPP